MSTYKITDNIFFYICHESAIQILNVSKLVDASKNFFISCKSEEASFYISNTKFSSNVEISKTSFYDCCRGLSSSVLLLDDINYHRFISACDCKAFAAILYQNSGDQLLEDSNISRCTCDQDVTNNCIRNNIQKAKFCKNQIIDDISNQSVAVFSFGKFSVSLSSFINNTQIYSTYNGIINFYQNEESLVSSCNLFGSPGTGFYITSTYTVYIENVYLEEPDKNFNGEYSIMSTTKNELNRAVEIPLLSRPCAKHHCPKTGYFSNIHSMDE